MPIYEYVCKSCRHEFEVLIRGQERPKCPECGGTRLGKKWSVPAAHTAGSAGSCTMPQTGACDPSSCCNRRCGWQNYM